MFPSKSSRPSRLEIEISQLVNALRDHRPESEEYGVILERISKLEKIQKEREPESISPDAWLAVTANLVGIVLIIKHEQFNVITSKALGFVIRPR